MHTYYSFPTRQLLQGRADVDRADRKGDTPLHIASNRGHVRVVTELLEAGADKAHRSKYGAFPLRAAAFNGHVEVSKLLLQWGCDVHQKTDDNRTALDAAKKEKKTEVVRLLEAELANPGQAARKKAEAICQIGYLSSVQFFRVNCFFAM